MIRSALSSASAAGPFRSSPIAYRDRESSSGMEPLPMYVWTTGIRALATNFLRLSLACALAIPAPAMMTGNLAFLTSSAAAFQGLLDGIVRSVVGRISLFPSALAAPTSSGPSKRQDQRLARPSIVEAFQPD